MVGPASPSISVSGRAFNEPWMKRVVEVDDATMEGMLHLLLRMRRIRFVLGCAAFTGSTLMFGILPLGSLLHTVLVHVVLGMVGLFPVLAVGTLAIRRLVLQEGRRNGMSLSAAMLILTRAERRLRHQMLFRSRDLLVVEMMSAVRDWDRA